MNTLKENRKFGLIVGAAFIALSCWSLYKKGHFNIWTSAIGSALLILGLLLPRILTPVRIAWEKVGYVLGQINTIILLTLIYALVVTPIGIINRLLGKDALKLKRDAKAATYWEPRTTGTSINLKRQF